MKIFKIWLGLLLCYLFTIFPIEPGIAKQVNKHKHQSLHTPNTNHKKSQRVSKKRTRVNQNNYQKFWYKSTFPTPQASIDYHTKKHGNGRTQLQYTRDAINFYEKNKRLRKPFTLLDGSQGYKINRGTYGGYWTKNGKIVTFWD